MGYTYYNPLKVWLDPASIADVVSYMQKYLSENPIKDTEEINQIIADYIAAHPEIIGGVQSVNGETGDVVLTASDINTTGTTTIQAVLTSLSSQISDIAQTVTGLDIRITANATGITNEATARANADTALGNRITAIQGAVGSPLVASIASEMTDTSKIYVYTGSETGYTSGNWYYYNGTEWTSGGVYNAVAINTDTTLTVAGMAADAKATGDRLNDAKNSFTLLSPSLKTINLFDYNDCVSGSINASGVESFAATATTMITQTPVPINGTSIISQYPARRVYYDANGDFIERTASADGALDCPVNAIYVRFMVAKTVYNAHADWMINAGTVQLQFVPFRLYREIDQYSFNRALEKSDVPYYDELFKVFKRVGVVGDSLSVGYSQNPNDTTQTLSRNLPYSWPKCVGRDSDSYWLNFGTSGQNVLTWCSDATYGKVQLETTNNKCQLYIIGLGENDYQDVPIGTPADIVDDSTVVATTYYGGYARIIQLIKAVNVDAKIICLTNPRESTARKPFNDAVRYIAGTKYTHSDNVYLLDMATEYGTLFTDTNSPLYIDKANISHYSPLGYQIISKIMESAISKLMNDYYIEFMNVAFIPYDTGTPTSNTITE